jgi:glycolate oxidase FAD binding subunit
MDREQALRDQVRDAFSGNTPLCIRGGGSKAFYAPPSQGETLVTAGHSGVVGYDPGELVLTCRGGTRLAEITELLATNGQHLPFDPPAFGDEATIGGTIACGLSGPARPWAGALRDYLLGVKIINGRGEVLRFGGQVMKNVAGYDVSRLMAGSRGTLGVILEASFKVLPAPACELTLDFDCNQRESIERLNRWSGRPAPLSASCWHDGRLCIRLSGATNETRLWAERLEPEHCRETTEEFDKLREHRHEFFAGKEPLWRIAVSSSCPPLPLEGNWLIEWGGAQRWYRGPEDVPSIMETAQAADGHATLFRGEGAPRFTPLPRGMRKLQERIRQAFDPAGILNPVRTDPPA